MLDMSNNGHSSDSNFSNVHKKLISVIAILVILVVVALGLIVFLLSRETAPATDNDNVNNVSGGRGTVVTQDNVEDIQQEIETETVQDGYYTASMSINWHFDGKVSKDAYVANVTKNTRTVYFDLYRTDTSEMIYSSPYIPVGEELNGLTLDTELEPGTYDTILVYHLVDDDENELSTLSIALTIYVE